MFELFSCPPLQGPFLKGITDVRMMQPLSKAALTNASGLSSYPADMGTGLGVNNAFPSPSAQGVLPWDLSSPFHWRAHGGSTCVMQSTVQHCC